VNFSWVYFFFAKLPFLLSERKKSITTCIHQFPETNTSKIHQKRKNISFCYLKGFKKGLLNLSITQLGEKTDRR